MPQGIPLVKVSLQVHENILLLDYNTVQTLELIENAKTGQQTGGSLFACVNQTKTAIGSRLMRSSLLQPPCFVAGHCPDGARVLSSS